MHVKRSNLYFVCTTKFNVAPAMTLELLQRYGRLLLLLLLLIVGVLRRFEKSLERESEKQHSESADAQTLTLSLAY